MSRLARSPEEMKKMKRPKLNKTDTGEAITAMLAGNNPGCFITLSQGQWDVLLQGAYDRRWTLLELDDDERPIAAYRKRGTP
jgi:hypothetical protein